MILQTISRAEWGLICRVTTSEHPHTATDTVADGQKHIYNCKFQCSNQQIHIHQLASQNFKSTGLFEERQATLIRYKRHLGHQEMVPGPLLDSWPESLQQKLDWSQTSRITHCRIVPGACVRVGVCRRVMHSYVRWQSKSLNIKIRTN